MNNIGELIMEKKTFGKTVVIICVLMFPVLAFLVSVNAEDDNTSRRPTINKKHRSLYKRAAK